MASRNVELRVGLLVIAAVIILVGTILWIQGYRFGRENYKVSVTFEEVGSLAKGDPVIVSGIRMGKVIGLELISGGVRVDMVISNEVRLKEDAEITVKNIGLMGERYIAIRPGRAEKPLDISEPVPGNYDTGIPEVMGMMGEMITELRNLVLALKNSVASDENLAKLTKTVEDFSRLAESLADYVQKNRDNLDQSARNFVEASRALKNVINRNAERVDSVIVRADDVARRMEEMTADLEYMATSAREFADKLNRGDGTLQMLVDDRRLYDDLRKTADNLDDLIQDIRENPRKYLQLKVVLF